jgi:hypothetical protein
MKKKPPFPNQYFNSQDEYFKFTDKYGVHGRQAYLLRKIQLKQTKIPYPTVKPKT